MKYKRRKRQIACASPEKNVNGIKRKKTKAVLAFFLLPLGLSLAISHSNPLFSGQGNVFDALSAVCDDAFSYVSHMMPHLSTLGKKGASFCFEYIRGNQNDDALAVDLPKAEKKKEADERPSQNSDLITQTQKDNITSDKDSPSAEIPSPSFSPSMPCNGEISSPFGQRLHPLTGKATVHNGIDIAICEGTEILSIDGGIVEKSEYNQFSGNFIVIKHTDGYTSSYAHLRESYVEEGDYVQKGDVIAVSGSTGQVTGPHLHMEIRKDSVPVDPMTLIRVN